MDPQRIKEQEHSFHERYKKLVAVNKLQPKIIHVFMTVQGTVAEILIDILKKGDSDRYANVKVFLLQNCPIFLLS